jgi:hypothetical protein
MPDPLKTTFTNIVNNNLDFYNTTYTNNSAANALGVITDSHAVVYDSGTGLAPWQDDFFTSAVGHTADLGFTKANVLLAWKSKFPILRMTGAGTCWIDAAIYAMKMRDSSTGRCIARSPRFIRQATQRTSFPCSAIAPQWQASSALKVGEMKGYSSQVDGYPSDMQPALAYAAAAGGTAGKAAWTVFANRSVKPSYGTGPQFAIVPR